MNSCTLRTRISLLVSLVYQTITISCIINIRPINLSRKQTRGATSTAFAEYESSPSTGNLKSSPSTSTSCGTRVRVRVQHFGTRVRTRVPSSCTRVLRPPIPKCTCKLFPHSILAVDVRKPRRRNVATRLASN